LPEHGNAYKCGKCGLNRQIFGNALYVWDDGIRPKPVDENQELKKQLKSVVENAIKTENYTLLKEIFDQILKIK